MTYVLFEKNKNVLDFIFDKNKLLTFCVFNQLLAKYYIFAMI